MPESIEAEEFLKHKKIAQFLDRACSQIKSKKRRQQARWELEGHILCLCEEMQDQKLSEDALIGAVLGKMGDIMTIEKELGEANKTPIAKLIGRIAVSLLVIGFIVAGVWIGFQYNTALQRLAHDEKIILKNFPSYAQMQNDLLQEIALKKDVSGKDAGDFLNSRIDWGKTVKEITGYKPTLFIDEDLRKKVEIANGRAENKDFANLNIVDLRKFDLAWMKELHKYSHWDMRKSGPLLTIYEMRKPGVYSFGAFSFLLASSKARLIQGLQTGDILSAIRDVEQLGRLLYSTKQSALIERISLSFMGGMTQSAFDQAVKMKIVKSDAWKAPLTSERLDQIKQVMKDTTAYMRAYSTSPDILREMSRHPEWIGICANAVEAQELQSLTDAFLDKKIPGEKNFKPVIEARNSMLASLKESCNIKGGVAFNKADIAKSISLESIGASAPIAAWITEKLTYISYYMPFARQVIGLTLGSVFHLRPASKFAHEESIHWWDRLDSRRHTKAILKEYSLALNLYYTDCGEFPTQISDLVKNDTVACKNKWGPEPYINKLSNDGWGYTIAYEKIGPKNYRLISFGSDGTPGGEGRAKDIVIGE